MVTRSSVFSGWFVAILVVAIFWVLFFMTGFPERIFGEPEERTVYPGGEISSDLMIVDSVVVLDENLTVVGAELHLYRCWIYLVGERVSIHLCDDATLYLNQSYMVGVGPNCSILVYEGSHLGIYNTGLYGSWKGEPRILLLGGSANISYSILDLSDIHIEDSPGCWIYGSSLWLDYMGIVSSRNIIFSDAKIYGYIDLLHSSNIVISGSRIRTIHIGDSYGVVLADDRISHGLIIDDDRTTIDTLYVSNVSIDGKELVLIKHQDGLMIEDLDSSHIILAFSSNIGIINAKVVSLRILWSMNVSVSLSNISSLALHSSGNISILDSYMVDLHVFNVSGLLVRSAIRSSSITLNRTSHTSILNGGDIDYLYIVDSADVCVNNSRVGYVSIKSSRSVVLADNMISRYIGLEDKSSLITIYRNELLGEIFIEPTLNISAIRFIENTANGGELAIIQNMTSMNIEGFSGALLVISCGGISIQNSDISQLIVFNSTNITIESTTIQLGHTYIIASTSVIVGKHVLIKTPITILGCIHVEILSSSLEPMGASVYLEIIESGDIYMLNNTFSNISWIHIDLSDDIRIRNNTVISVSGIEICDSHRVEVIGNMLDGEPNSLVLTNVSGITILNNTLTSPLILHDMRNGLFGNNTINDGELGIFFGVSDLPIDSSEYSEILISNSSNLTVSGGSPVYIRIMDSDGITITNLYMSSTQIRIEDSSDVSIGDIRIEDGASTIYISDSENVSIVRSTISNQDLELKVYDSRDITIRDNSAIQRINISLRVQNCDDVVLANNVFSARVPEHEVAIRIIGSKNIVIDGNSISSRYSYSVISIQKTGNVSLANNYIDGYLYVLCLANGRFLSNNFSGYTYFWFVEDLVLKNNTVRKDLKISSGTNILVLDNIFSGRYESSLELEGIYNTTIAKNRIHGDSPGIHISISTHVKISSNIVKSDYVGMSIWSSTLVRILNNLITAENIGIFIHESAFIMISGNTINISGFSDEERYCIYVEKSRNILISWNKCKHGKGLLVDMESENIIDRGYSILADIILILIIDIGIVLFILFILDILYRSIGRGVEGEC